MSSDKEMNNKPQGESQSTQEDYSELISRGLEAIDIPENIGQYIEKGILRARDEKQENPLKKLGRRVAAVPPLRKAAALGTVAACLVLAFLLGTYAPVFIEAYNSRFYAQSPTEDTTYAQDSEPPDVQDNILPQGIAGSAVGSANITALKEGNGGVAPDTQFLIETKDKTTAEELEKNLVVPTGESFNIEQKDTEGEQFLLSFNERLEEGSVYNIKYLSANNRPLSFAFQTQDAFSVTSTLPAGNSYQVPVDTGIEITFDRPISSDIADCVSFYPALTGRWEQVGTTYIFVPDTLAKGTFYNVSITNVKSEDGDTLKDNYYSFTFQTTGEQQQTAYLNIYGETAETFLPEDDAFAEVTTTASLYDNTFDISAYKISGQEYSSLALEASKNTAPVLPDGASLVNTIQTPLEVINYTGDYSYGVHSYVNLGTKLAEGYYFVQIKTTEEDKEYTAVKLIQSSYLSVYVQSLTSGICAWVNDTRTGLSVSGAAVNVGGKSGVTDEKGVALIENPALNAQTALSVTKSGDQPHYAVIYTAQGEDKSFNQKYYNYIYTDRRMYKPTDKVDVFGIIRPRPGQEAISSSDKLTICFGDIYEQPLTLDELGSFAVSIPVKDYSGSGTVSVKLNGEVVLSAYTSFVDYDKSMYILELSADKKVYEPGENILLTLKATTYDGNAASGVSFKVDNKNYEITTDSAGSASVSVPVSEYMYRDPEHWNPQYAYINVSTSGVEQKQQSVYTGIYILHKDVMMESEVLSTSSVNLTFNKIDGDGLENMSGSYGYINNDYIRGQIVDKNFTVNIIRHYSEKVISGEYYDYIEKKNVVSYATTWYSETIRSYKSVSKDGSVKLDSLPQPISTEDSSEYYSLEIIYLDNAGRTVKCAVYYGYNNYSMGTTTIKSYYISQDGKSDSWSNDKVRVGASASLQIIDRNHLNQPAQGGSVMYFAATDKILGTYVSDSPSFTVEFLEEYIPNVILSGAYFDGKRVYVLGNGYGYDIPFDNSQRKLDIQVQYDKDTYAPGDTVNATVSVADEYGKAVQTAVNISVVDEAALDATPYYKPSLYDNYYNNINTIRPSSTYASYTQHERGLNDAAERGGGDGEPEIRKNFEDNPAFTTVQTDENGRAPVSFKLGDSITSWRITLHALDGRDYIGDLTDNITATLPFYISAVTNEEYIEGDDITAYVKPLGSEQSKGYEDGVSYTADILKDGQVIASAQSESSEPADFNLGKQPAGEYILRLTGKYGEYSDGMELPFTVIMDGVRLGLTGSYRLDAEGTSALPNLDVSLSPVRLTMVNADIADIIDILFSDSIASANRTDGMAARSFISSYMDALRTGGELSGGDYAAGISGILLQNMSNLIPEIIYGSGDISYTSRFMSAFSETMDANVFYWAIKEGLYGGSGDIQNKVYNTSAEYLHGAAFLLAAATGQPMLSQLKDRIQFLVDNKEDYLFNTSGVYEQYLAVLFYAAALCEYGDDTAAADLLSLFEPYKASQAVVNYNNATEKQIQEYIKTMELFVNTTLNPPAALEYIKTKDKNTYVSDTCELIRFVREYYPVDGITSEVEYTLDGEKTSKTLTNFESAGLVISREQFEVLSLTCASGRTAVYVDYIGGKSNLIEEDRKITLERTITPVSETEAQVTFAVTLPEGTPQGWYNIVDRLPVNLRYSGSADSENTYYVQNTEKQFVELYFEYKPGQSVTLSYKARVVSSGEATAESAFVSTAFRNGDIWGESGRSVFKP